MASAVFCESFTFDATTNSTLSKNITVSTGSTFTITGNLNMNYTESTIYLPTSDKIFIGSSTLATNINTGSVPRGVIMMWSGTVIPDGWVLCNGQTASGITTPNLCGRFVIGVGTTYPYNTKAGNKTYTMTAANIPAHTHTVGNTAGGTDGDHSHSFNVHGGDEGKTYSIDTGAGMSYETQLGGGSHTHGYTTPYENGTGTARTSVTPISILPRYYVLSYIMKL
jgi:microcystin-dependent protein